MKLDEYCNTYESASALARRLKVSAVTIHHWRKLKRPISALSAVAIEPATAGKVTRQESRPDDWWLLWPELAKKMSKK